MLANIRHENFAVEYVKNGGNATEAYRKVYPGSKKWTDQAANNKASALCHHGEVAGRISELRNAVQKRNIASLEEACEILSNIARDKDRRDRVPATMGLAKILGWEKPQQVELSGSVTVYQLDDIRAENGE